VKISCLGSDVLRNLRRALDRKRVEGEALELQKRLEQLVFERTAQLSSALQSAEESHENTLLALGAALALRDGQTADHSRRVCEYSLEIARRMGCSEVQLKSLSQGAFYTISGSWLYQAQFSRSPASSRLNSGTQCEVMCRSDMTW